eukprot:scaffold200708_cov32-Tisochrysis_lutea.AAC.6
MLVGRLSAPDARAGVLGFDAGAKMRGATPYVDRFPLPVSMRNKVRSVAASALRQATSASRPSARAASRIESPRSASNSRCTIASSDVLSWTTACAFASASAFDAALARSSIASR